MIHFNWVIILMNRGCPKTGVKQSSIIYVEGQSNEFLLYIKGNTFFKILEFPKTLTTMYFFQSNFIVK